MKLRVTPRALLEIGRMETWWRTHRPDAADLFERELDAAVGRARDSPELGRVYTHTKEAVTIRRLLLPRTRNHVYYAVEGGDLVVLAVWGARKGEGPEL